MLKRQFAAPVAGGLLLFGLAASAPAASVDKLPQDVSMVIVVDVDGLKSSPIWKKYESQIMTAMEKGQDADYVKFKESTGFDPSKNLKSVTLGIGGDMTAGQPKIYAVLDGTFDQAKIDSFVKGEAAKFKVGEQGGLTTYTGVKEEGKTEEPPTFALVDGNTLILASTPDFATLAGSVKGTGGVSGSSKLGTMAAAGKGQIRMAMVLPDQAKEQLKANPQAAPLANVQTFVFGINADTGVEIVAEAAADGADNGKGVYDTLNGFVAMGKMMSAQNPELQAAMNNLKLEQDAGTSRLTLTFTPEQIDAFVKQAAAASAAPAEAAEGAEEGGEEEGGEEEAGEGE